MARLPASCATPAQASCLGVRPLPSSTGRRVGLTPWEAGLVYHQGIASAMPTGPCLNPLGSGSRLSQSSSRESKRITCLNPLGSGSRLSHSTLRGPRVFRQVLIPWEAGLVYHSARMLVLNAFLCLNPLGSGSRLSPARFRATHCPDCLNPLGSGSRLSLSKDEGWWVQVRLNPLGSGSRLSHSDDAHRLGCQTS